jgi:GDP-L-fucose synthase
MSSILITGHKGLLGSACVRRFKKNHTILTFHGDLTDRESLVDWMDKNRPDHIIHCAARVGGIKANRDNPVEFLYDNVVMELNIFLVAEAFDVKKVVFIGSSCMYPRHAPLPVKEEYLFTGPFEPDVEAYAVAKVVGYELCQAYHHQLGKNYMTVAPCNLYGIGDNYGPTAHVIPSLLSKVKQCRDHHTKLNVWGDGTAIREFLYADDCAEAIEVVLERWNKPDLINIGSSIGTNIRTLVETILRVTEIDLEVVYDKSNPTGIQQKVFDTNKIQKLGWGPIHSLEEGLEKTWYDFNHNPVRK